MSRKPRKRPKFFAATSSINKRKPNTKQKSDNLPTNCVACKQIHPLWKFQLFRRKTPSERAKLVVENKLCSSCLNADHSFRQYPQPCKCTKEGCGSCHNTYLHGVDRIFPQKYHTSSKRYPGTSTCIGTTKLKDQVKKSSGLASVPTVKALLQNTEVELHSVEGSNKVLALCDSACCHTWFSASLASKLRVQGIPNKMTVHGINSKQVFDTQMVELKLTPVQSGSSCSPFTIKPYLRDNISIGTDAIDVDRMKTKYPHLKPVS